MAFVVVRFVLKYWFIEFIQSMNEMDRKDKNIVCPVSEQDK